MWEFGWRESKIDLAERVQAIDAYYYQSYRNHLNKLVPQAFDLERQFRLDCALTRHHGFV